ncbi:DEAD/DEAH box helicase [Aestuariicella hydrocarbonica]|uniref:DEAD-box ATP-dependent RNA helicase RhpA n=1 Tax=Pseudomaricurvus hydrocarbonicus TaxID=1470433 RepID=A0A9E5T4Y0_9GAMM|nr:DEAD/DEAH box helicase [Aestuariicella hydrocarbonica]NHO68374.1 DEAD/DEAH box helicase [Aestuariicella hydrocarbonica]
MPFSHLGLSDPLLRAVAEQGYTAPTEIQQQAIPAILAGRDVIAAAQTGTGKTASFVLPLLQKFSQDEKTVRPKRIRALILTPTRELAEQVENNVQQYGQYVSLTSLAMVGGVDPEPQKQGLIAGVDILVATPGRLLDMAYQRAVYFDELEVLVLDEADRMLDMGFIADINKIIERLPPQRQNLLFSATLSDEVRFLAKTTIHQPVEISVSPADATVAAIDQWLVTVDKDRKSALLSHLITEHQWQQALIFIRTKHGAAKLVSQLGKRGISADAIHGDRSQAVRSQILADFKAGKISLLVATDIAARGIDIDKLSRVINYDLPDDAADYIHRIGRTGRAGELGEAVSLVSRDDFRNLCAIESRLGHIIARKDIEAFAPKKEVPVSILNYVPKNAKAPRPAKPGAQRAPSSKRDSRPKASSQPHKKTEAVAATKKGGAPRPQSGPKNASAKVLSPWAKWESKNKK